MGRQKHWEGKQAAQGNQVMELGLHPGSSAPETVLTPVVHWLIGGMNEWMNAKSKKKKFWLSLRKVEESMNQ